MKRKITCRQLLCLIHIFISSIDLAARCTFGYTLRYLSPEAGQFSPQSEPAADFLVPHLFAFVGRKTQTWSL
jgi:hypothetical protein